MRRILSHERLYALYSHYHLAKDSYGCISITGDGCWAGDKRHAAGEDFRVIQDGAQVTPVRNNPYKQNAIAVEPHYEVIDGVIYVMAAPKLWHQRVFFKMAVQLDQQLAPHGCEVVQAPFDMYLFWEEGDKKNFVQPDLFIACDQE